MKSIHYAAVLQRLVTLPVHIDISKELHVLSD